MESATPGSPSPTTERTTRVLPSGRPPEPDLLQRPRRRRPGPGR